MKRVLFAAILAFSPATLGTSVEADVFNDTYTVLGTSLSGPSAFINHAFGGATPPNALTFSAATGGGSFIHRIDNNAFGRFDAAGNALDEIVVIETATLSSSTATSDSFAVSIGLFSREIGTGSLGDGGALGTLSNYVAAGTLAGGGAAISNPLLDIGGERFGGSFGAADALNVTIPATISSGLAASGFVYDGGTLSIFETDADSFPITDGAGGFFDPTADAGGGVLSAGTPPFGFFAGDIGVDNIVDAPFAGSVVTFNYTITAVPEPSSCAVLALGAPLFLRRRRRS